MINAQQYVADMCESIQHMKLTPAKKEFARAVMRAAVEYANAKREAPSVSSRSLGSEPR